MRAPATGERWEARRLLALLTALAVGAAIFLVYGGTARADDPYFLEVDGVTYSPSKFSGPVRHYETPDTDPTEAHSDRHVWVGNGHEHLPCANGIHWIDNENVLTVSNCLDGSTTTSQPTTTSSSVDVTTTSQPTTTSSSVDVTTTSQPTTTSSSVDVTTTSQPTTTSSSVDVTTTSQPTTTTTWATTTTVEDSTTTTVEDSTTTTVEDSTTTTVEDSTTTTVEVSATTTVPVSSTTQDGSTTTTLTLTTDPDDPEVKPTIITTPDEVEDDELPFTGIDSDLMIGLAILLSGVGAALLALTRRVEDN